MKLFYFDSIYLLIIYYFIFFFHSVYMSLGNPGMRLIIYKISKSRVGKTCSLTTTPQPRFIFQKKKKNELAKTRIKLAKNI